VIPTWTVADKDPASGPGFIDMNLRRVRLGENRLLILYAPKSDCDYVLCFGTAPSTGIRSVSRTSAGVRNEESK